MHSHAFCILYTVCARITHSLCRIKIETAGNAYFADVCLFFTHTHAVTRIIQQSADSKGHCLFITFIPVDLKTIHNIILLSTKCACDPQEDTFHTKIYKYYESESIKHTFGRQFKLQFFA